jgi:hypothetical protein
MADAVADKKVTLNLNLNGVPLENLTKSTPPTYQILAASVIVALAIGLHAWWVKQRVVVPKPVIPTPTPVPVIEDPPWQNRLVKEFPGK